MKVLGEIEAEMRALGIWDAKEGTFEHWLQHHLSEPGLYDRAHAEWVKWGPEDDAPKNLLVLLRRLDRLREFHPQVERFGFYKTSESAEVGGGLHWPIGRYETTVSYWGEPIATGEFEIV